MISCQNLQSKSPEVRANIHEVFHSITVILEISERARVCNYCIALCRYR